MQLPREPGEGIRVIFARLDAEIEPEFLVSARVTQEVPLESRTSFREKKTSFRKRRGVANARINPTGSIDVGLQSFIESTLFTVRAGKVPCSGNRVSPVNRGGKLPGCIGTPSNRESNSARHSKQSIRVNRNNVEPSLIRVDEARREPRLNLEIERGPIQLASLSSLSILHVPSPPFFFYLPRPLLIIYSLSVASFNTSSRLASFENEKCSSCREELTEESETEKCKSEKNVF